MTERLDRVERLLERMGERLDQTGERLDQTGERLDRMGERLDQTGERLDQTAAQQRQNTIDIDNLLGAIAVTETTVQQLTARAEETDRRFETLRAEGIADRLETRQLFNDAVNQMNIDRARNDNYHRAQMEVVQSLLLEIARTNRRVDGLEQAS